MTMSYTGLGSNSQSTLSPVSPPQPFYCLIERIIRVRGLIKVLLKKKIMYSIREALKLLKFQPDDGSLEEVGHGQSYDLSAFG